MLGEQVLDLLREDVLTAGDDHVVVAPVDEQQPVLVEVAHVAAGHVAVDDLLVAGRRCIPRNAPRCGRRSGPACWRRRYAGRARRTTPLRQVTGERPAVPGALRSSSGVAMVAKPHSVERVDVVEDIAESVLYAVGQLGGQRRPGDRDHLQRRRVVGAMTSGPSSTMRCSIVGTATSMSALWSAISCRVRLRLEPPGGDHLVAQARADQVGAPVRCRGRSARR